MLHVQRVGAANLTVRADRKDEHMDRKDKLTVSKVHIIISTYRAPDFVLLSSRRKSALIELVFSPPNDTVSKRTRFI